MVQALSRMVKTYFVTTTEKFFDGLDDSYVLIVFDEFHGQHPITFMNQVLDGQTMNLPQKGHQFIKRGNQAVIVLSNIDARKLYPNIRFDYPEQFEAFCRRFDIVNLETSIHFLFN